MFLTDYIFELNQTVNHFTKTGFILSFQINSDFRTEKIGFVKGEIIFSDNSKLFFKEYLDLRYKIEKETYSFHYQSEKSNLIFRYDNAFHKPPLGFQEHKHIGDKIIFCEAPSLKEVLQEILSEFLLQN